MDRIASLRLAAKKLSVSLYRSLPFGYRFARALTAMSAIGAGFGQAIGTVFLKAGVQGMPDAGPRWNPDLDIGRAARTLPAGYMADFGEEVFRLLLKVLKNPERAEDFMMEYLTGVVIEGKLKISGNVNVNGAKSYVRQNVMFALKTSMAKEKHRRELAPSHSMGDSGDEDGMVIEVDDPSAMRKFDEFFDSGTLHAVKSAVAKILPWAPAYLDMLMDGVTNDRDIIGDPVGGRPSRLAKELGMDPPYLMSPQGKPMTIAMWSNNYKPKIWDEVKKALVHSGTNVEIHL
jgi:hypothetical protein